VAPMADARVGAVAGNAKVGNRVNIVTQWQAVEYVTSQNTDRRAFSLLDCITVVPGAVGAWRRALVREAGGFSDDTLAEDQDLTLEIRRRGHSIAYADQAIAYTEAPDTLRGLAKQRFRWSFGTLQCMWKHRDALFRPRYGTLGLVAMPNVWLFQLVFAALSPVADLMFVLSLASIALARMEHGDTFALLNLEKVLTFYAVFLVVDWLTAMIAFLMEPAEDRRLTWLILIQRFAYRQVMYWVVLRSFAAALRGRVVGWGSLERKATVTLPARTHPA
jgi:peptidoglycan-N-acetylglucosamine deacetylase